MQIGEDGFEFEFPVFLIVGMRESTIPGRPPIFSDLQTIKAGTREAVIVFTDHDAARQFIEDSTLDQSDAVVLKLETADDLLTALTHNLSRQPQIQRVVFDPWKIKMKVTMRPIQQLIDVLSD